MHRRMKLLYLALVITCVLASLFGSVLLAQQAPSEVGRWNMNLGKSTGAPGLPPKSQTVTIEAGGPGTKIVVDAVQADGAKTHWEYTAHDDGKDNPVTGVNLLGDMAARKRINPTTTETTFKKDGKVTVVQTAIISTDGKTRTLTTKGVNATGQTVNGVIVYDRQ
jgi:hypothetical protein